MPSEQAFLKFSFVISTKWQSSQKGFSIDCHKFLENCQICQKNLPSILEICLNLANFVLRCDQINFCKICNDLHQNIYSIFFWGQQFAPVHHEIEVWSEDSFRNLKRACSHLFPHNYSKTSCIGVTHKSANLYKPKKELQVSK